MSKKAMVIGADAAVFPLIQHFASEGSLPNLRRLMEEGASGEAACCIPCYTPTNWATLCTGAYPITHGATNWVDSQVGDRPGTPMMSTFDSRATKAETIWEAAERAGLRSLCASYPGAYPKRTKTGYGIAPLQRGLSSLAIVPGAQYATEPSGHAVARLEFRPATGWRNTPAAALASTLVIQEPAGGTGGVQFDLLLVRSTGQAYDRLLICDRRDAANPIASLAVGDWSPWIFRPYYSDPARPVPYPDGQFPAGKGGRLPVDIAGVREGSTRFKLLRLSPDGRDLRLIRSEVYPITHFTDPLSLSEELIREVGPYFDHPAGEPDATTVEADEELRETMLEEVRYHALWHPRAASYVQKRYGWDLYQLHWHWPDAIAHTCLSEIDPQAPGYHPHKAPLYLDFLRRSYQILDEMVGEFLKLADDDTYVLVVSDHGDTADYRVASGPRRLEEVGLATLTGEVDLNHSFDFARSKAYRSGPIHVSVNLKGREPQGIVEPADFEKVQDEIVDALQTWRDPDTGKLVMAFALKKRDAALLGLGGDRVGDVICQLNHGYFWGDATVFPLFAARPGVTVIEAPPNNAHHGPNLPTDRTGLTSNMATFIIRGPQIRPGYSRDPDDRGFVRLVDVVPTLCHLLDFAPPKQSEGTVLWDHLVVD